KPPTGEFVPPDHIYVGKTAPVCVDNVKDPNGDRVSLVFVFQDTNGNEVGQKIGPVWQQPGGAWCQNYQAPDEPQQVTVFVTLSDGRGGSVTLSDNVPIWPDQF
ncbi:hypothetical protein COU91_03425, partial [Candidatus Saccharibacteria bacterium CG10_big_fil_rev_8_21_14_0_10_47_8]